MEAQEKYSWSNLWPQSLPKYLPADFEFVEENPLYDEKKATEEAYEPNLTESIIPSYWIDLDNDDEWQAYVDGMYSLGLEDWGATQGIEEIAK